MALPVISGGIRIQVSMSGAPGQKPWSTKFDYVATDIATAPEDAALVFRTAFEAAYAAWTTTEKTYFAGVNKIQIYKATALKAIPQVAEVGPTANAFGTGVGGVSPQVALVTTLRTANAGRSYRGRQYWGGIGSPAVSSSTGQFVSGFQTSMSAFMSNFLQLDIGVSEFLDLVVISTVEDGAPRIPAIATPVTSVSVDSRVDTQRRRVA